MNRLLLSVAAAAAAAIILASGAPAVAFVPAHLEPVPDAVRFTAGVDLNGPHLTKVETRGFGLADLDLDGNLDAVLGYEEDTGNFAAPKVSKIEVRRGGGDGVFFYGGRIAFGTGIDAEDLDLDVVVGGPMAGAPGAEVAAIARATGEVVVLHDYTPPPPHFASTTRIAPRWAPVDLLAHDVDGDGDVELLLLEAEPFGTGMGRSAVTIYGDGGGAGLRRGPSIALPRDMNPAAFAAGDLTGDGFAEIAIVSGGDGLSASVENALVVLLNVTGGPGQHVRFVEESYLGTPGADVTIGGFDADSFALDVAVLAAEAAGAFPFVRLNEGTGLLGGELPAPGGAGLLLQIDAGDLNGDGAASEDLFAFEDDTSSLRAYYDVDALGFFELDPAVTAVPLVFADFVLRDLNADGLDDLLVLSDRGGNKDFDTVLAVRLNVTDLDWPLVRSAATEAVVAEWEAINAGTAHSCSDYFTGWLDADPARRDQIRAEAAALPFWAMGPKMVDTDGDFAPDTLLDRVATFVGGTACNPDGTGCLLTEVDVDVLDPFAPLAVRVLVECD